MNTPGGAGRKARTTRKAREPRLDAKAPAPVRFENTPGNEDATEPREARPAIESEETRNRTAGGDRLAHREASKLDAKAPAPVRFENVLGDEDVTQQRAARTTTESEETRNRTAGGDDDVMSNPETL